MIYCGSNHSGKDMIHEVCLSFLAFIFEAIPLIVFSMVIGVLWFLGIAIFSISSALFF